MFLRKPCSLLFDLIKNGCQPTAEDCLSQLQLNCHQLLYLVESALRVLETIFDCTLHLKSDAASSQDTETFCDDFWTISSASSSSSSAEEHQRTRPSPLTHLCRQKSRTFLAVIDNSADHQSSVDSPSVGSLDLHVQLAAAMRLVLCLDISDVRLVHCFSKQSLDLLFRELSVDCRSVDTVDNSLVMKRRRLLQLAAAKITHKVYQRSDGQTDNREANEWISACLCLADQWGIRHDVIYHKYVLELFSNGLDQLAHEQWSNIVDMEDLDMDLFLLASSRLCYYSHTHWNRSKGSLHHEAAQRVFNVKMPLENYCVEPEKTMDLLKRLQTATNKNNLKSQISTLIYTFESLFDC